MDHVKGMSFQTDYSHGYINSRSTSIKYITSIIIMELYHTYPKLCTLVCFLEISIYAGQLFGWSSVMYVLKEEGFYMELCEPIHEHSNTDIMRIYINQQQSTNTTNASLLGLIGDKTIDYSININDATGKIPVQSSDKEFSKEKIFLYQIQSNASPTDTVDVDNIKVPNGAENDTSWTGTGSEKSQGCYAQDAQLNLWFSVAICASYISCSFMGPILHRIGMRPFRTLSMLLYVTGALCLGLASPEFPWLIAIGLSVIGISGMALYATNIHISYLFPAYQSTITAVFVGLFDFSAIVSFLMKVAFDAGLSRKYFYIVLATVHVCLVSTSTYVFLPNKNLRSRTSDSQEQNKLVVKKESENPSILPEKTSFITQKVIQDTDTFAIYKPLLSLEYMLHVYWMCCQSIRFVTFLGFFNTWIETKFNGHVIKENYYLALFSYVTMATAITAVTAGMLHDCQRRKYLRKGDYHRRRLPIILPLTVTSLLSVLITALTFVKLEIFLNFIFIIFTFYRSYLFSYEITFLNDIYPLQSFPVLFGVLHSSAGLAGMLQSPLFEWFKSSDNAPVNVNYFLMGLGLSSLAHPLYVWYNCRRHKNSDTPNINNMEIYI